jgi:hypothetical protein
VQLLAYLGSDSDFKPEQLRAMTMAFEWAVLALNLPSRPDLTLTEIARTIIRLAKQGVSDPTELCEKTVVALSPSKNKRG